MNRVCWLLVGLLLLATAGLTWRFILSGQTVPASDGRQAILLTPPERDLVLAEMRTFLESTQLMLEALSKDDMVALAAAARRVGSAATQGMPGSLMAKLPLSFKRMGLETHRRFDQLALDAEQLGDPQHALAQLGELMQNCVACHASYRIDPAPVP